MSMPISLRLPWPDRTRGKRKFRRAIEITRQNLESAGMTLEDMFDEASVYCMTQDAAWHASAEGIAYVAALKLLSARIEELKKFDLPDLSILR
jgi:hypothetical protein